MTKGLKQTAGILLDPILLGCLVCALAIRLYGIDKESLWYDEIFSIRLASGTLSEALNAERNNPPLHFVLLHLWMYCFGTSAISARALSVIPSTLAIAASYLLAYRLFNRATARVAAAFLCFSSFQIYYAQEARTFSLLLCLLTISLVALERLLSGQSSRRNWIVYVTTTIVALYAHFYAVFFVTAHNVLFLTLWKKTRPILLRWTAAQCIIVLAFVPWLVTMLGAASAGGQQRRHLLLKLPQSFFSFLAGDTLIPLDERAVRTITPTLLSNFPVIMAALFGFGFFAFSTLKLRKEKRDSLLFCLVMIVIPVLIPFLISFKVMLFEERYLIGVTVPLIIVLSASAAAAFRNGRSSRISAVAAGLVITVLLLSLKNYFFNPRFGRDEWREATAYIDNIRTDEDVVLFEPDYVSICYDYYSIRPAAHRYQVFDNAEDRSAPENASMYAALKTAPRIVLVRSNYRDESFLDSLNRDYNVLSQRKFEKDKGLSVYIMGPLRNSAPAEFSGPRP